MDERALTTEDVFDPVVIVADGGVEKEKPLICACHIIHPTYACCFLEIKYWY